MVHKTVRGAPNRQVNTQYLTFRKVTMKVNVTSPEVLITTDAYKCTVYMNNHKYVKTG